MPEIRGLNHIALTVTDVPRSAGWYRRVFDAQSVYSESEGGNDFEVLLLPGGTLLGLRKHSGTEGGDRFSHTRVGLDHVALGCATPDEVDGWMKHLDELGVEHSGVVDSPFGRHLNFRDPDNIPLEFFCAASS